MHSSELMIIGIMLSPVALFLIWCAIYYYNDGRKKKLAEKNRAENEARWAQDMLRGRDRAAALDEKLSSRRSQRQG